jgi:pilus assembly protein Flp/PilA
MRALRKLSQRLINESRGVTSIEYALIASLIAVAIVAAVGNLSSSVTSLYHKIDQEIANAMP